MESFTDLGREIYVIDAIDISIRAMGKNLPNTPLLAAVARLTGIMGEEEFRRNMQEAFEVKFATKPEVVEGNMSALREAWGSVICINEK